MPPDLSRDNSSHFGLAYKAELVSENIECLCANEPLLHAVWPFNGDAHADLVCEASKGEVQLLLKEEYLSGEKGWEKTYARMPACRSVRTVS